MNILLIAVFTQGIADRTSDGKLHQLSARQEAVLDRLQSMQQQLQQLRVKRGLDSAISSDASSACTTSASNGLPNIQVSKTFKKANMCTQ